MSARTMRSVELQQQPFATALEQVDAIAALPEDWDSYGAARIAPTAVQAARALLNELASLPRARALLPFHVAPIPTGGIQLEWKRPDGSALELWIGGQAEIDAVFDRPGVEPRIVEKHLTNLAGAVAEIEAFVV